ncbi:hypothetical protein [Arthrobacter sp. Y-9]|uniref:hypothetical protein n=1 Tax=Arthrobacter sp. Y-9 TaxID=3039385 RepID=UPI00241BECC7|nr:hypothetical protein [Arthrobacter sp. Y-9]WFR83168.1 hypothetical protein P9849_11445 [Arthrobacter sp. Y-9]
MLSLIIPVLLVAAVGALAWAVNRQRATLGAALPAGAGVLVTALSWIIFIAFGLGYLPGWTWLPWIGPLVLGIAASFSVSWILSSRRSAEDAKALTEILKV